MSVESFNDWTILSYNIPPCQNKAQAGSSKMCMWDRKNKEID